MMSQYKSYCVCLIETAVLNREKVSLCCKAPDVARSADRVKIMT